MNGSSAGSLIEQRKVVKEIWWNKRLDKTDCIRLEGVKEERFNELNTIRPMFDGCEFHKLSLENSLVLEAQFSWEIRMSI